MLGPKDKSPSPHGWGKIFHHTDPQRRLPTIAGSLLVPASADDIPPIPVASWEAVDDALTLLAALLTDHDHWLFMGGGEARRKKNLLEADAIERIRRGLQAILRVEIKQKEPTCSGCGREASNSHSPFCEVGHGLILAAPDDLDVPNRS